LTNQKVEGFVIPPRPKNYQKMPFNWNFKIGVKKPRSLDQLMVELYKTKFDIIPGKSGLKKIHEIDLKQEVAISQLNFVQMESKTKPLIETDFKGWEAKQLRHMEDLDLENLRLDEGNEE
jgi:hypothetical protein